jgi:hypothetical protein
MLETLNERLKYAHQKGYYVDMDGNVVFKNKKRKPILNGKYYIFTFKYENKSFNVKIHRLQAYQKYGDIIFNKNIVVRHLNGNSLDNSFNNIEIGSYHDNTMDIPKEKRLFSAKNAASFNIKYNADDVKKYYQENKSYKKTMEFFGIKSKNTLYNIIHNR